MLTPTAQKARHAARGASRCSHRMVLHGRMHPGRNGQGCYATQPEKRGDPPARWACRRGVTVGNGGCGGLVPRQPLCCPSRRLLTPPPQWSAASSSSRG